MSICYLVGSGNFNETIDKKPGDVIIAADGGYDSLIAHGYRPDIIIGDCDSMTNQLPDDIPHHEFPSDKEFTDMMLAYACGRGHGYKNFVMLGALGGERFDHSMANLAILLYAKKHGDDIVIIDGNTEIHCVRNGGLNFKAEAGKKFSLVPIGADAKGVTMIGAKYNLNDATLECMMPIWVSNEFTDRECMLHVHDGAVLVIINR